MTSQYLIVGILSNFSMTKILWNKGTKRKWLGHAFLT